MKWLWIGGGGAAIAGAAAFLIFKGNRQQRDGQLGGDGNRLPEPPTPPSRP